MLAPKGGQSQELGPPSTRGEETLDVVGVPVQELMIVGLRVANGVGVRFSPPVVAG